MTKWLKAPQRDTVELLREENTTNSHGVDLLEYMGRLLNGFPADLGADDVQWMFKERVTLEGWRTWDTHMTPTKRRHDPTNSSN